MGWDQLLYMRIPEPPRQTAEPAWTSLFTAFRSTSQTPAALAAVMALLGWLDEDTGEEAPGLKDPSSAAFTYLTTEMSLNLAEPSPQNRQAEDVGGWRLWLLRLRLISYITGGKHKARGPNPALHLVLSARHLVSTQRQHSFTSKGVVTFIQS